MSKNDLTKDQLKQVISLLTFLQLGARVKEFKTIKTKFKNQLKEWDQMELSKNQMKLVIAKLEGSYNSKTFADENLQEIINLFKNYLNGGETK